MITGLPASIIFANFVPMKQILTLAFAVALGIMPVGAKVVRGFESASDETLGFRVDSIDYRKDLTRVYGTLLGRPHTSARLDGVVMIVGGAPAKECTDIDGVDFNRYFQWEDDGAINVELDFAPIKAAPKGQLIFSTPRGKSTTSWHAAPEGNRKK